MLTTVIVHIQLYYNVEKKQALIKKENYITGCELWRKMILSYIYKKFYGSDSRIHILYKNFYATVIHSTCFFCDENILLFTSETTS